MFIEHTFQSKTDRFFQDVFFENRHTNPYSLKVLQGKHHHDVTGLKFVTHIVHSQPEILAREPAMLNE